MSAALAVVMQAQAEPPSVVLFGETEIDVWPYRDRTVALLKRYARASVEVGRLPSLLGREFFRSRVTSYSMASFEDVVIFVHDVESALARLDSFHQRLIAMSVLEEYRPSGSRAANPEPLANRRTRGARSARHSLSHVPCGGTSQRNVSEPLRNWAKSRRNRNVVKRVIIAKFF